MSELTETFNDIYRRNRWNGTESLSGPGSTKAFTGQARKFLERFIKENDIYGIFDAGCGDFNWMSEVEGRRWYFGMDLVPSVIAHNVVKYATDRTWFTIGNYVEDELFQTNLIICRESLQHLSPENVAKALDNFKETGSDYLMATTYPDQPNGATVDGGYYPYNLDVQFGLGHPIEAELEPNTEFNEWLAVWKL